MRVYKENNKFFMEDNNNVVELTPDRWYYLHLPTNSVNRQCVSCKKVDKAPNQCIDYGNVVKQPRTNIQMPERKDLSEYLTGEDKATYLRLVELAKANREEERKAASKKAPTKEELLKQIADLHKIINELNSKK